MYFTLLQRTAHPHGALLLSVVYWTGYSFFCEWLGLGIGLWLCWNRKPWIPRRSCQILSCSTKFVQLSYSFMLNVAAGVGFVSHGSMLLAQRVVHTHLWCQVVEFKCENQGDPPGSNSQILLQSIACTQNNSTHLIQHLHHNKTSMHCVHTWFAWKRDSNCFALVTDCLSNQSTDITAGSTTATRKSLWSSPLHQRLRAVFVVIIVLQKVHANNHWSNFIVIK